MVSSFSSEVTDHGARLGIDVEVTRRDPTHKGCKVIPRRRWVVEPIFGWLLQISRRLTRASTPYSPAALASGVPARSASVDNRTPRAVSPGARNSPVIAISTHSNQDCGMPALSTTPVPVAQSARGCDLHHSRLPLTLMSEVRTVKAPGITGSVIRKAAEDGAGVGLREAWRAALATVENGHTSGKVVIKVA